MSDQIVLTQPQILPSELLLFLIQFFSTKSTLVKKAYVAEMHLPISTYAPRVIIAIETHDGFEALSNDLCEQLKSANLRHNGFELVDLLKSPFQSYFSSIDPFYTG